MASPTKSDKQIVRENLLTYFNLIFVVLAVCLLLVGDWKDMTFLLTWQPMPSSASSSSCAPKRTIEKPVPPLRREGAGSFGTERSGSCRWTSWCGRTW